MSSTNNLEREEPGARCSLNIRTNTGVKMIRQHPLLVNAHRNDEEGRLFEHRSRDEDYESGRTVEFCVQGEYDIDDALSLMSRSSSVASISSFASDLSHRTSGIESPSELSDSPCQTAPTSPMSNYISVCCDVSDEVQTRSAADRMDLLEVEVPQEEEIPEEAHSDEPPAPAEKVHSDHIDVPAHSSYVEVERRISRASSSSSFSVEDASPSERAMLEECIRAGLPLAPPSYQLLGDASIHLATAHREQGEEKGKEDERKAEKNRLFRIPESPGVLEDKKAVLDQVGNRRSEKQRVKDVPNQLEFLMKGDKNIMSNNELAETTKHSEPQESYRASVDTESALPADEPVNFVDKPSVEEAPEDILKSEEEEEAAEKDIDCSESDEVMLTSSLLGEAREIAQLLAAGSTEDMTVSTLSCLSDIDNARPPSAMGELHCLSADDSIRTTQLLSKQLSSKKSLLRELQLGRLASSTDSPDNLSLRSSCTSDLLANVNPPSILDNVSLSSSMESEGGDEKEPAPQKDSLSERMHEAAAMAQMCARELSAITGGGAEKREERGQIRIPVAVQQQEVTIADVTDIGWGSDTEVEEDLPCDDEETLRAVTRDEGSSENLTFTLTEEQPRPLMTSEEFRALQENAHRVLRTLRDVEVSDDDDDGGHSGDLLDDETMSLVSNGSDEDSPKASPTCNNGLPRPKATATFPHSLDTRTFTRKRASVPRDMVPTVRSPASEVPRPLVQSKVAGAWKGRSKSADVSRNAKIKVAPPAGPLQRNEDRNGSSPRSTPSPKSPLSRSGTFERLSDAETSPTPAIRRPSSLAIANRTRSAPSQKHANDRPRPSILSPSGGIPRKTSGIPAPRRSMIPMPAKFGTQEN